MQAEDTAKAKYLRWECAYRVEGMVRLVETQRVRGGSRKLSQRNKGRDWRLSQLSKIISCPRVLNLTAFANQALGFFSNSVPSKPW